MNTPYTYRLYKNAGKTIAWWEISAVETASGAELVISHATSPEGKFTPKHTPVKPKNIGKANETTPIQQAVLEAQARVLKQIDKGYVRTVEEAAAPVTNGLGKKKPQLSTDIRKVDVDKVDYSSAYLQPKLNGNRGLDDGVLYSRAGNAFTELDHITNLLEGTPLRELHLDGEIYVHDGTVLQIITGLIKKKQPGTERLQYWLYDIVSDEPFPERLKKLTAAYDATILAKPELADVLVLTRTYKVTCMADVMVIHDRHVSRPEQRSILTHFEGSILRWGDDGYEDNKRTKKSLKLKPFEDHEFKVVDYKWATPNRDKHNNELLVPVYVYEISPGGPRGHVTAPGDMYEKHDQGVAIDEQMGKMMTITHMGYTLDGIPDVATAKCWHDPL